MEPLALYFDVHKHGADVADHLEAALAEVGVLEGVLRQAATGGAS
jgi:hypothetical protein